MPKKMQRLFQQNSFLRNVSILAGGTAFSQLLIALSLPILTRLYTADDFSHLAVYMALMGVFTVVACLRFNLAIPLPENEEDAMGLTAAAIFSGALVSFFIAVPVMAYPVEMARMIGKASFVPYLWMLPFGVFLASTYVALQSWSARKKRFALIAKTQLSQAVGGTGMQLVAGATSPAPFGLIFGHMLFGGLGVLGLLRSILKSDREALRKISWKIVIRSARAYKRFPIYSVPEAFFNTAGVQVPVLIVAAHAVGPEAGFLMLAMRVLGIPMTLIGRSVSHVYLAEAAERMRGGELTAFTRKTVVSLAKIGLIPLLIAGIASPYLFPLIFGTSWERAGYLVSWMVPWFLVQFVTTPVSSVLHVTGNLVAAMHLQLFGLIFRVGAVAIAGFVVPHLMVETYAISGLVFYLVYLLAIAVILRRSE